jgi:hypothetical protein
MCSGFVWVSPCYADLVSTSGETTATRLQSSGKSLNFKGCMVQGSLNHPTQVWKQARVCMKGIVRSCMKGRNAHGAVES